MPKPLDSEVAFLAFLTDRDDIVERAFVPFAIVLNVSAAENHLEKKELSKMQVGSRVDKLTEDLISRRSPWS